VLWFPTIRDIGADPTTDASGIVSYEPKKIRDVIFLCKPTSCHMQLLKKALIYCFRHVGIQWFVRSFHVFRCSRLRPNAGGHVTKQGNPCDHRKHVTGKGNGYRNQTIDACIGTSLREESRIVIAFTSQLCFENCHTFLKAIPVILIKIIQANMGVGKIFSKRGCNGGFFQRQTKSFFQRGSQKW